MTLEAYNNHHNLGINIKIYGKNQRTKKRRISPNKMQSAQASYEGQDDIQLMRFADYFGRTFSGVPASQFSWVKLLRESPIAKVADVNFSVLKFLKVTKIQSIDGKIIGRDGKAMMPIRQVQFGGAKPVTQVVPEVRATQVQSEGDSHVHEEWESNEISAMKITELETNVNFRKMVNPKVIENSNFDCPLLRLRLCNINMRTRWVSVWVKMHKVPFVAYSADGSSFIASQIGNPISLDAFTSAMCVEAWGRIGFARAVIEVIDKPTTPVVVSDDGFTTVVNRRSKGKGATMAQKKQAGGFKSTGKENTKEGENIGIKLKNLFEKLKEITSIVDPNSDTGEIGMTSTSDATSHHNGDSETSWNIQGLNHTPKQFEVRQVVNENNLSVCAILESRVDILALNNVCSKVFRYWEWSSNASLCTKGCRIILGWNKDVVDVLVVAQSDQAIHKKIFHKADNKILFCTFVYARNKYMEMRHLWAELDFHKQVVRGSPWVLMGDFNVALNIEGSFNGSSSMNAWMCNFKDCVKRIEVIDINSFGLHYTWNQKPKGRNGIRKKLGRIMGNIDFIDRFPGAYALFQPCRISDHSLALLRLPSCSVSKPKPFKFYNFLTHKSRFLEVVVANWSSQVEGHSMFMLVQNLKTLKKPLRKLLHDQGNLHNRVIKLHPELDEVQKAIDFDPSNSLLRDEEVVYLQTFNEAKIDEERFLNRNQRSRIKVINTIDNVEVTGTFVPEGNLHNRVIKLHAELDEVQKAIDFDPSNSLLRDEEAVYLQTFNEANIDEERFLK
nr:hypothetical protein [Tanacetum cinerariifolium]